VVTGVTHPPEISLSHSGCWVVAAVAWRPVGVDVEKLTRDPLVPGVLRRVCSPRELDRLERLSPERRSAAFLRVWTRKEAYGKASGLGMGFQLRDVTVGLEGSRVRGARGRWWVTDLELGPGRVAALVVHGPRAHVRLQAVDAVSL
jgi:4'-phosphopantetheinyl transferase